MDEEFGKEFLNNPYRIWDEWEKVKINNADFEQVFSELEDEALKEIDRAKDIVTINGKRISEIALKDEGFETLKMQYIVEKIGYMSIYKRHLEEEEDLLYKSVAIDNVSLFRAVLIINLFAIVNYEIETHGEIGLRVVFENEEYKSIIGDMIDQFLKSILKKIKKIELSVI